MKISTKYNIEESEYRDQLEELIFLTERLKSYSKIILYCIFFSIIFFVVLGVMKRLCMDGYFRRSDYSFFMIVGIAFIVLFIGMSILYLLKFNEVRKRGMILYDELTDEIDWSNKRREYFYRPPIDMRIIIKEFIKATDLPFTSGVNGLAFYFIILIAIIVTTVLLFTI